MALRTIAWRTNFAKLNGDKTRGLIAEYELFVIEKREFEGDNKNKFMLTVRLGRTKKFRGIGIAELRSLAERYYENFLRATVD